MCLAAIALGAHARYRLVVAANRDEIHARPAAPAAWGEAAPFTGILAGRDLEAGGTWLGLRRDGAWALLTNVRQGGARDPAARSRGDLVPQVLAPDAAPVAALHNVMRSGAAYNGFNLVTGAIDTAAWASNRHDSVTMLGPGIHGLSNAQLDTPWPKVARARRLLAQWCADGEEEIGMLFEGLEDRRVARDAELPATGVSLDWERALSAMFIAGPDYGTRCSTVLTIDRDGNARFCERSFDARGERTGEVNYEFALDDSTRRIV